MVSARRETGNKMEEEDFFRDRKQFPYTSAWPIVNFFERVAFLWAKGRLDIGYLDVAYREYIFRIWADFEKHLSGNLQQGRFLQLESLRDFFAEDGWNTTHGRSCRSNRTCENGVLTTRIRVVIPGYQSGSTESVE